MNRRTLKLAGIITEKEEKFNIKIPNEILTIQKAFSSEGKKLYLVGGAIRDALIGKVPKDFDIATEVSPKEVSNILTKHNIKNFPKGEQFGVVSAVVNGEEIEIATFREEDYKGSEGRRPTSVSFSNLEKDVMRRDLTINALYYDIEKGVIIDLVGGINDLKNKIVKPVGNPIERFDEDRLRVLRALRFAHRFNSKLNKNTIDAIKHFRSLPGVSNERIRAEFISGLKTAQHPEKFLQDYYDFGIFPRMFGNININNRFIKDLKDPVLVISNLLIDNNIKDVINSLQKFTATNTEKENVKFLLNLKNRFKNFNKVDFIPEVDGKWLMALKKSLNESNKNIDLNTIKKWAEISNINKNIVNKFVEFVPDVSAKDFPEIKPGPELGKAIISANAKKFISHL